LGEAQFGDSPWRSRVAEYQGTRVYDVKKVTVKVGAVAIIPPGGVHGRADIPDHVDYLSFRPSYRVAG
jgi:hypothetical protein